MIAFLWYGDEKMAIATARDFLARTNYRDIGKPNIY
jgi:hypothetical protein